MTRRLIALLLPLLIALGLALPAAAQSSSGGAAPLTVFAAASLKNALDEASAAYAKDTATPPAKISYAASSVLAKQIEQGAPADVFLSADSDWMDYLAGKGLIQAGSRKDLYTNHLALVAPKESTAQLVIKPGFPLAAALGANRLAMAGPDVPAGRYGQQALTALGIWDQVKDKTARGDNVGATLQFVARGEAPFGIVYDTDANAEPAVKIVGLFPESSHAKIVYPGAVIATSKAHGAAPFLTWLHGPKAAAIFRKYGFAALK
jgi:molybdate transport system substrate-binding protein